MRYDQPRIPCQPAFDGSALGFVKAANDTPTKTICYCSGSAPVGVRV